MQFKDELNMSSEINLLIIFSRMKGKGLSLDILF